MGIGLDLLLRAKHGDGPVAEVIVQLGDCAGDDAIGFLPRPALLQHGFADPADKQRLEQALFRLMEQQVGVELAVAGQGFVEDQPQHGLRLVDLAEGLAPAVQILQGLGEKTVHRLPGRLDPFRAGIDHLEKVVDVSQEPGIRRAGRKIEISEDFLPCLDGIRPLAQLFHAKNLRRCDHRTTNLVHPAVIVGNGPKYVRTPLVWDIVSQREVRQANHNHEHLVPDTMPQPFYS